MCYRREEKNGKDKKGILKAVPVGTVDDRIKL